MSVDRKQKLELTWVGKENRPKLEPRIRKFFRQTADIGMDYQIGQKN
jgi:hypothetical protein